MKKIPVSAIVLAHNEVNNIRRCLESLEFCDEIIVVDDCSTDNTKEVSARYNAIYSNKPLNGDFSNQRNYAISKAKNSWFLYIDTDEKVSPELKSELIELFEESNRLNYKAYYIKRRDWFWERELKYGDVMGIRNNGLIRLMQKNSGKWEGKVHEKYVANCQTSRLTNYIDHYPHPTIKEFLDHVNYYSTLRAKELYDLNIKTNIFQIIFFPLFKFILNYFIYLGLLDKTAGFTYAFMMSFHSFLVRAKLYQYTHIKHNVS